VVVSQAEQQTFLYRSEAEYTAHTQQMLSSGWGITHHQHNYDGTLSVTWSRLPRPAQRHMQPTPPPSMAHPPANDQRKDTDITKLPVIRPSIVIPTDEIAHFEGRATHVRVTARGEVLTQGRLIVTSRRLFFISAEGTSETALTRVIRVTWYKKFLGQASIFLESSGRHGNAKYLLKDAENVAGMIHQLIQIQNRHIIPAALHASRQIPQHVKAAVYQRDQGRCIQCGSDQYLEFDHIIPWSKGGASSVDNLQLLCRGCNALKGDRL